MSVVGFDDESPNPQQGGVLPQRSGKAIKVVRPKRHVVVDKMDNFDRVRKPLYGCVSLAGLGGRIGVAVVVARYLIPLPVSAGYIGRLSCLLWGTTIDD